uniref:GT23 domain-containing protein n=1 Tax=Ciona intestinalis TaxID=7719 RepID=H2XQC4_CIOIN
NRNTVCVIGQPPAENSKGGLIWRGATGLLYSSLSKALQLQELLSQDLTKIKQNPEKLGDLLSTLKRHLNPLENSLVNDLITMQKNIDTNNNEIKKLNKLAQELIRKTQNPPDCRTAKKLHCDLRRTCGFGCLFHHYGICLFVAIGTNRVMQVKWGNIRAYPGIPKTFRNISDTCINATGFEQAIEWKSKGEKNSTSEDAEIVKLIIQKPRDRHTPFSPWTVPANFLPRIEAVHSNPMLWWIGQVQSYLMRPQEWLLNDLETCKKEIGFDHPIVGVHIRRTDKISEAAYVDLSRYMVHAKNWFDRYAEKNPNKSFKKRIYLATDEVNVTLEANERYPEYQFISGLPNASFHAAKRREEETVKYLLHDVYLLRDCDYFVGTFSSNIGQMVYELRQALDRDTTFEAVSLDNTYLYIGQSTRYQKAIMNHIGICQKFVDRKECEIDLRVGDRIKVNPKVNKGYMYGGRNMRTGRAGLYPAYKVRDIVTPARYP